MYRAIIQHTVIALTLLATRSAHPQWELQNSGTKASLRGITNVGGGVAWASGTDGAVLRTEDGGYLWQGCATPPGAEHLDFRGIQAFDENTAIVMSSGPGDQSRLYKTTDGCRTWKLLFTNPDKEGFWDALQFDYRKPYLPSGKHPRRGVLVGDPVRGVFAIYETADSGENWTRWEGPGGAPPANTAVQQSAKAAKDESLFAASNSAVIAPGINGPFAFVTGGKGAAAHLFVPEPHSPFDNGTTWKFSIIALPFPSGESAGAFSVAARDADRPLSPDLMIVGGDYKKPDATENTAAFVPFRVPAAALVSNVFSNRVLKPRTPPHGYRSSVAYDPTTKTWITVGPNGSDYSTDDGRNWRPLTPTPEDSDAQPGSDRDWNALSLPFVVGPHGRIGRLRSNALPGKPAPANPKPSSAAAAKPAASRQHP